MKYFIYLFGLLLLSYGSTSAIEEHISAFATEPESIEYLSLNYPDKAIELYKRNSAKLLTSHSEKTVSFYNDVLVAASSVHDTVLIEELVGLLAHRRLDPFREPYLFAIINVLGVSYGTNLQYVEAIAAYKCALTLTDNKLEKMIAKVNLAIAYRMADQPALSYQILQSIDESILSGRRIAGVLVVKGNTAMVLREVGAAIDHYTMARHYYIKAKHHRNAARVTVNLLGAALADGQWTLFDKVRKTLNLTLQSHLTDNESAYLLWLDKLYGSLKNKKISSEAQSVTLNLAPKLLAGGYLAPVKMILEPLGAMHLVSLEVQTESKKSRLRPRLIEHWCGVP